MHFFGAYLDKIDVGMKVFDMGNPVSVDSSTSEDRSPETHNPLMIQFSLNSPKLISKRMKTLSDEEFDSLFNNVRIRDLALIADKLTPGQFDRINKIPGKEHFIKKIPLEVISRISSQNLEQLDFSLLTNDQIAQISTAQILGMSSDKIKTLLSTRLSTLTTLQLHAICSDPKCINLNLDNISADQIKKAALDNPSRFSYKLLNLPSFQNPRFTEQEKELEQRWKLLTGKEVNPMNPETQNAIQFLNKLYGNGALLLPEHIKFLLPDNATQDQIKNFYLIFPYLTDDIPPKTREAIPSTILDEQFEKFGKENPNYTSALATFTTGGNLKYSKDAILHFTTSQLETILNSEKDGFFLRQVNTEQIAKLSKEQLNVIMQSKQFKILPQRFKDLYPQYPGTSAT